MSTESDSTTASGRPPPPWRIALSVAGPLGVFAALLFLPAGRADWTAGWLYLALVTVNAAVNYAYLLAKNPELIAVRRRIGPGTKTWDKVWMAVFIPALAAIYVVAGLDAGRFGWSAMSPWLWPVGLAVFLPGAVLLAWSMGVNPFFEKTVRIQTERGQRVIDTGPYRIVRHPGYTGFLGWVLSAPLLLGSWWAFVPALLAAALVVLRTALEDRTLHDELPGYPDYARRTRFQLIPHVW